MAGKRSRGAQSEKPFCSASPRVPRQHMANPLTGIYPGHRRHAPNSPAACSQDRSVLDAQRVKSISSMVRSNPAPRKSHRSRRRHHDQVPLMTTGQPVWPSISTTPPRRHALTSFPHISRSMREYIERATQESIPTKPRASAREYWVLCVVHPPSFANFTAPDPRHFLRETPTSWTFRR